MKFFIVLMNDNIHRVGYKKPNEIPQLFSNSPTFSEAEKALDYLEDTYGPGIRSKVHLLIDKIYEYIDDVIEYFDSQNLN